MYTNDRCMMYFRVLTNFLKSNIYQGKEFKCLERGEEMRLAGADTPDETDKYWER